MNNVKALVTFLTSSGPTKRIEIHLSSAAGLQDRRVKPNHYLPFIQHPTVSMFFTYVPEKKRSLRITIHPIDWQGWIEALVC